MKRTALFVSLLFLGFSLSAKSPYSIKVATFNIRLDTPVDGINTWSMRKDSVCVFLQNSNLTVFGLQEVKHNQLVDLQNSLPEFSSVGVGRDDGKEGGEYSPVFFNHTRLKLLDSGTFWLSETPAVAGSKGWDAAFPRISTWVKLNDLVSKQTFYVFNTHFDHLGVEARRKSAQLILRKAAEIAPRSAIIILGDFNSAPTDEAYRTLAAPENGLLDAHLQAKESTGEPWSFHGFGSVKPEDRVLIDFVFVNPKFGVQKYENPFVEHAGRYLSDHNPQIVTLSFR